MKIENSVHKINNDHVHLNGAFFFHVWGLQNTQGEWQNRILRIWMLDNLLFMTEQFDNRLQVFQKSGSIFISDLTFDACKKIGL